MSNSKHEAKWNVLQVKLQEHNACKVFDAFQKSGIEPILIKGYAAARYYPKDVGRSSVDLDLCVAPGEFELAQEFIAKKPIPGVSIDLHRGLRHLDSLAWEELFSRSEILRVGDSKIRVLSPEDDLRVLCVHWLTDGGENKKRLWDIYYAVANRSDSFDWEKCLGVVSENRRNWIIYTIGLAARYLDLDLTGLPFEEEARNVPDWLQREVKRHWDLDTPIVPLSATLDDRNKFWKQLRKRIPPNPIHATISMEGSLDSRIRFHYQVGNLIQRLSQSWKSLARALINKRRARKSR